MFYPIAKTVPSSRSNVQQLNLEQLIYVENGYTHPSAWVHVEQFSIFIFLCINDRNKLFKLKRKLEFGELMYIMTCMVGDMP